MKKQFSETVCAWCIIFTMVTLFLECATAQTVETRRDKNSAWKWNNAAWFEGKPKEKFFDWGGYGETNDKKQYLIWAAFAGAGVMWGCREAYHADPYIFEKRRGVGSESFWGSDAWKRNYVGNDPDNRHKHEWLGNFGRDVHHTFGFGSKAVLFTSTFAIGARKHPIKYRVLNAVIGWAIHSAAANVAYNALR